MNAPDPKRTTRQYSRFVGIAFLAFVVFVTITTLSGDRDGGKGLANGDVAPRFAAPAAGSTVKGDANLFQTAAAARSVDKRFAACAVPGKDVIRVCDLWKDSPLVIAFGVRRCERCDRQFDTIQRLRRQYPEVNFLGVYSGDSAEQAGKVARENGWTFPIAADQDLAVMLRYNFIVPPALAFIYPGGRVMGSSNRELDEQVLREEIDTLVKESKQYASTR